MLPLLKYQQSLIIVKPDAMGKLEEIVTRVEAANFTILDKMTLELSEARAHNFFEAHKSELSFPSLVRHMTSGPVCAMVVARMSAVSVLQQLAGPAIPKDATTLQPKSLRGLYARDIQRNAVHVSESEKAARKEIAFFFPNILQNPLPDAEETQDFLLRKSVAAKSGLQEVNSGTGFDIEPSLLQFVSKGLVSLCQTRPHGELNNLQALEYLSTWLVNNNPNKPEVVEPEVEIPVAMVSEGAAYTVEEPVEEMPTVVEVNVAAEKGDKYMVEFEAPPLVAIYLGDSKTAAEVAAAIDYKHLDLATVLQEEGDSGTGQIGKEIQRKLAGGEPPLSLDLKLKLPVLRTQMFNLGIGRFLITGLTSQTELLHFEQEVAEITSLLVAEKAQEETPAVAYYAALGKVRSLADAEDKIEPAKKLLLPKVMYFLAPSPDSDTAVCEKLEAEYGYCHINVPGLLKKMALEDTAVGKTTKAALDAGECVHEKIVGPEIVEQINGARRFGFTSFVLCGFPQTVEQLRFFESQVTCYSEAIFMDYPRAEIMDAVVMSNTSIPQEIVEKTVNLYYSTSKTAVKAALASGPCAKVHHIPATTTVPDVAQMVFAAIRPSVTIVLGPSIAIEVKEFAVQYANTMGAVHVDVDAILDAELERKTEVGVEMANMLARGQVIPLRMILEVIKAAAKWTSTEHLVLTSFPRYLDEADALLKQFTVKKVIMVEAGEGKAHQIFTDSGLTPEVFKDMMNRVLAVGTFFAAQGLMQRVELTTDLKAVPKMLEDCTFKNRPKCIAFVGLPFVGTTEVAEALKKEYGFAVVGKEVVDAVGPVLDEADPEKKLEKAKATVKMIEEAMDSATAPCLAIDDLLTDTETYAAYVEAFGEPPVNVVYLTCSDETLEAKKANVVKDDGDAAEIANARVEAVKATLDMGGGEDGVAKGADHYLNKPVLMPWTPEYFKKVKDVEVLEASEGTASKEYLKAQTEVKEAHFPIVQKVNIPDKLEGETDAMVMAGVLKKVAKLVQPTVHCVLAPQARGVGVTIASVLAASAAGRQVVLDAVELATPNPRYSAAVNTALKAAAALGEPILPDIWAEIFAERLKEYSLQHVFLANYPGDAVRTYPTVRDELDVLAQFASVKGLITTEFTQRAMQKYCFKGAVEAPDTAAEAFAFYRSTPVTDIQRYSAILAAKTSYLKEVDMEREKWVTELEVDATEDALPQAAREGALAVLQNLQMLP
jgi:nucleoside-diphosphate kinase